MMDKKLIEESVFEALFRQAVIDNYHDEIDALPSNEELSKIYSFSPEFELRMKKLFSRRRAYDFLKTSVKYTKRIAAVFVIAVTIVFGALLINPEVRAAVGKVLTEWFEEFTSFNFFNEESQYEEKIWTPEYLPDGFYEDKTELLGNIVSITYINSQGEAIFFTYEPIAGAVNISIDNENHEIKNIRINERDGYVAYAPNEIFDNGVIWSNSSSAFSLWSKLPAEELIKIAESVIGKE